ncbi:MAG: ABC transporter ATP-binding protein [Acidimicrobiia bacterium]|nr:ABC transporter ATP-binding protein [Acidimicrobiia bacterium]
MSDRSRALESVSAEPGVVKPDPVLIVDSVSKSFGALRAVDVDHMEIQRGTITALIGPNGAGKTTLFNLLTGFDRPDQGTWTFDGQSLKSLGAHRIARTGMVRTFQLTKALTRMTVMDNMRLGAGNQNGESMTRAMIPSIWAAREREVTDQATELLHRFQLHHMRDEYAGTLSGGQRKLLELARLLMSKPRIAMLDEPMAGVNPALTESLLEHVKNLPNEGMTVMFVEHDMDVVMDISDWIVVMGQGRIIAEGRPHDVAQNQEVIDAYLGAHHEDTSVYDQGPVEIDHDLALRVAAGKTA